MAWMNEGEIDRALEVYAARAPELRPYVKFLADWRDTVNGNSDGWSSWAGGTRCASKLMDLIGNGMGVLEYGRRGEMPTAAAMGSALSPIKAAATRNRLPQPVLEAEQRAPGPRF